MDDGTDIELLVGLTKCTPVDAERALKALMERGWQRPKAADLSMRGDPPMTGNGALRAYTDGACSGNPGPGGWAVVFGREGVVVGERSGAVPHTTNNQMELTAIREAVRHAPAGTALEIVTDSGLVIGWLSKGFKRNNPQCAALCREIEGLAGARTVDLSFVQVKGHAGDVLNDRADKLAVAATRAVRGGGASVA